jgi:hypothetical protein
MSYNAEVENGVGLLTSGSYGAGTGSRASNRNATGRAGRRNSNKGSVTRTRNRIAAAQGANRGRGSRARRSQLNDLATQARGNSRGNINRAAHRNIQNQIRSIERQLRGTA